MAQFGRGSHAKGSVPPPVRVAPEIVGSVKMDLRSRVLPMLVPRDGALALELAIDAAGVIRPVTVAELAEHGMTVPDAHIRAIANLRARSTARWQEIVPGLLRSPWADGFDGARLALTSLIRNLPIAGTPIAVIPNRNTLLVTGSEEAQGLAALARVTELLSDEPLQLVPLALVTDDWRPLEPIELEYALGVAPSLLGLWSLQREHGLRA